METNSDFVDLLRAFNDAGVEYLIGAYAVALYARPRATGDLDVLVRPSRENAERVHRALAEFGAPLDQLAITELQSDDLIFQIGVGPVRVDVITSIDGVDFESAWVGKVRSTIGGVAINVIGREELVANKRAAGRPKALADLETLLDDR